MAKKIFYILSLCSVINIHASRPFSQGALGTSATAAQSSSSHNPNRPRPISPPLIFAPQHHQPLLPAAPLTSQSSAAPITLGSLYQLLVVHVHASSQSFRSIHAEFRAIEERQHLILANAAVLFQNQIALQKQLNHTLIALRNLSNKMPAAESKAAYETSSAAPTLSSASATAIASASAAAHATRRSDHSNWRSSARAPKKK